MQQIKYFYDSQYPVGILQAIEKRANVIRLLSLDPVESGASPRPEISSLALANKRTLVAHGGHYVLLGFFASATAWALATSLQMREC